MAVRFRRELGLIVAWLVFPLVPVMLEDVYYQSFTSDGNARFGREPRDWDWQLWVMMLGPLVGYGFLAGATIDVPDNLETPRRSLLRRLFARRSVWVAVGPWCGGLVLLGSLLAYGLVKDVIALPTPTLPGASNGSWTELVVSWLWGVAFVGILSYGWLWPAWAGLLRAARIGRLSRALYRGLSVALAFVGSLFGSFWAVTSLWRSHFFDPRLVPLIVVALGLVVTSGCAKTITYGELRRRELFHAMLVAWVLGLALMWRWWSRRRPRPP